MIQLRLIASHILYSVNLFNTELFWKDIDFPFMSFPGIVMAFLLKFTAPRENMRI